MQPEQLAVLLLAWFPSIDPVITNPKALSAFISSYQPQTADDTAFIAALKQHVDEVPKDTMRGYSRFFNKSHVLAPASARIERHVRAGAKAIVGLRVDL